MHGLSIKNFTYVHLWAERKSLNEEHGVLKLVDIGHCIFLPDDLDWLGESCWNETLIWDDLGFNLSRGSVHKEGDVAVLARV